MYVDIHRHLGVAVRRKRPEKWRANSWLVLPDNAPTHRSSLVMEVLAKSNVATLEHPSYSPDLTPGDFYLFPRLKLALNGRSFCDATDVIKNATEELKRLLQNDFQGCSQHLYSR
jgi:transposase